GASGISRGYASRNRGIPTSSVSLSHASVTRAPTRSVFSVASTTLLASRTGSSDAPSTSITLTLYGTTDSTAGCNGCTTHVYVNTVPVPRSVSHSHSSEPHPEQPSP